MGVIVFISPADIEPLMAYLAYEGRWEIEIMNNLHKNILKLGPDNVHDDYRIIATEFINFLSVIMGCRMKKFLIGKGVYGEYSQREVTRLLKLVRKVKTADGEGWQLENMHEYVKKLATKLDIIEHEQEEEVTVGEGGTKGAKKDRAKGGKKGKAKGTTAIETKE